MHRNTGPTKRRTAWLAPSLLLCLALTAIPGLSRAKSATDAPNAPSSGYEVLPSSPGDAKQAATPSADRKPVPLNGDPAPAATAQATTKTDPVPAAKTTAAKDEPASAVQTAKDSGGKYATGATFHPKSSGEANTAANAELQSAEGTRQTSTEIKEPADFKECVRVALVQSPALVRSALEIESRRLDVQDAWSTLIPTISINTTYWFRMPTKLDGTSDKPYTISFSSSQWNPIVSGFEVKARKEMTNIAILAHLKILGEGLKRLATDFIQLDAMNEQQDVINEKMDVARKSLAFSKTRLGLGEATQLDIKIAETKITMTKAEMDKLEATRKLVMDDVKFILGVPFVNKLNVNLAKAKQQILGRFTPADLTLDKARAHSFELRIYEYEKSLQKKSIALSWVKLLPTFGFTFQTVDAFNNASSSAQNNGFPFYPGINVSMPLDYWTKGREVSRQYKKLDQTYAGGRVKEFELAMAVQKNLADYQSANAEYNLTASMAELAKLQYEQSEYRHKSGQLDFDKLASDHQKYLEAKQKTLLEKAKLELNLLNLKHLSGDLENQYIDVASWEN